jgi:hypothetical protein
MRYAIGMAVAIAAGLVFGPACPGEEWSPYYHADPADEVHPAELERQAAVRRQVQLNDAMRWRAGFPPANGVFYYPLLGNLESIYAFGRYDAPPVFTPWPQAPGDIWGYQHIPPSQQPIGQVQRQTGPNRWESRPVYATPPREAPPVSAPAPELPFPWPPAPRGPREF